MDPHEFEYHVREAISTFPPHIQNHLHDVAIVIADHPLPGQQRHGSLLLGLYEGVPLTTWGRDYSGKPTDKITIFRQTIEHVAASPDEIPSLIRKTVWHEVGHYFGFNEKQIRELEEQWR